jgi:AP2-like factor, euAP2 lineage
MGTTYINHKDGNPFNNRRKNLEPSNVFDNTGKGGKITGKVGYRGVRYQRDSTTRFEAAIKNRGRDTYLGTFNTAIEAALAVDKKAIEIYGKGAYLNKYNAPDYEKDLEIYLNSLKN